MTGPEVLGCLGRIRHLQLVNACGRGSGVWSYVQSKHAGAAAPCQHQRHTGSSVPGLHQECHSPNDFHSLLEIPISLSLKLNHLIPFFYHHQGAAFCGKGMAIPMPSDEAGTLVFSGLRIFHLLFFPCPSSPCALCLLFQASQPAPVPTPQINGLNHGSHLEAEEKKSILYLWGIEWVAMPHCQELVSLCVRIVSVGSSKPNSICCKKKKK